MHVARALLSIPDGLGYIRILDQIGILIEIWRGGNGDAELSEHW